jgi:hypothetical protein
MKRILLSILLLALSIGAQAQFSPNTTLTAAALNAALAAPTITAGQINGTTSILTSGAVTLNGVNTFGANTTAVTQNYLAASNAVATSSFVHQSILAAAAALPISVAGSGTYNLASPGTGAIFGIATSGGAITSVSSIVAPGTSYQVGDCLVMVGGNGDALVRVTTVSSGGVTAASVLYGGTGYTGTPQLTGMALPPGSRTGILSGILTGNVTIIVGNGTYLAGARRAGFANNTTGAFSVTVKLSNGAGGSTGTGVVLPQGTNNSTSILLYTDGVTDIWPEVGSATNLNITGTLTVAGIQIAPGLSGTSASIGGSGLAQGACSSTTVTITGVTTAMVVRTTPVTYPGDGFYWQAYVSASNTVTVTVCSAKGGTNTPTASAYNVRVTQ